MALFTIRDLSIGFRGPPLLDQVSCQVEAGQRIGLLGRNGSGKTTFMRILSGEIEADRGEVSMSPNAHVALLPQDVPQDLQGTIAEIVAQGTAAAYAEHDAAWQAEHSVDQILARMELDGQQRFESLSSGM